MSAAELFDLDWQRYCRWGELCTLERCAYTRLSGNQAAPPWRDLSDPDLCPGYAGYLHVEGEVQTIRVRSCPRKDAWWARRQKFIRDERAKQRERDKAAK